MVQRIVVLGAGFAGLWSAAGAARALDLYRVEGVEILVIDRTNYHSIRVRNYEAELGDTIVSLKSVLDPIGVRHLKGNVTCVDVVRRTVSYTDGATQQVVPYDRLVCALGSCLDRPPIPGLEKYGFDIDTYEAGQRLNDHIAALPSAEPTPGQFTVLIVGAGLTGIEAAAEMPGKLRAALGPLRSQGARVILADRKPWIGSDMGESARPVIAEALQSLGIETRTGISLAAVDADGATLGTGERIATATIVWCAGMRANALTAQFPVERDGLGRLPVDEFLKVQGLDAEFAAGDTASLLVDGTHRTVMSCQHGRPMGRFAGHNVICDLIGRPMLKLRIDWYTTILDLGPWGAVCTEGWDRKIVASGMEAKRTKETINRERIYPPRSGDRRAILEAAEPVVQPSPLRLHPAGQEAATR
jgi:NADH dehydrogenase